MRNTVACLAFFCFIVIAFGGDCSNPLLAVSGFTALSGPTTVSGLNYCKSLKEGQSCCSAADVNTMQTKVTTLTNTLTTLVTANDRTLVSNRDTLLPALQQTLQQFKDMVAQLSANSGDASIAAAVGGMLTSVEASIQQISTNFANIKDQFNAYQRSRSTCFIDLINLQAAAWCLSCDPNYASKGVSGPGKYIEFSETLCLDLQASCYPYVTGSVIQSALTQVANLNTMIATLVPALTALMNSQTPDILGFLGSLAGLSMTVQMPLASCDSATSCLSICSSFFKDGKIDQTVLVNGGMTTVSAGGRVLEEEEPVSIVDRKLSQERLLPSAWEPDDDEAGVTVTFSDDPANVKNDETQGAALIKSSLVCLTALLAIFLL